MSFIKNIPLRPHHGMCPVSYTHLDVYKRQVPILSAPLIFISTALTHLAGGSAGREGAAIPVSYTHLM